MLNMSVQNEVLLSFLNVETEIMELERQKLHTTLFSYVFLMFWSLTVDQNSLPFRRIINLELGSSVSFP